ncbi:porin [Robbsia sp. KACC 23696]|uniref:porin n=1 Tax=Robbsia sp. KACC 23696 TaxID=3149231 RepID=UPI00325C0A29
MRAACIAGLVLIASAAQAQSSVTLYGIADSGIRYSNDGHGALTTMESNGWLSSSRVGFLGHEDLGAGWKANFQLEEGFSVASGALDNTTGVLFNRMAYIGLSGPYGALTLGRQWALAHDVVFDLDPFYLQYPTIVPLTQALDGIHYSNDAKYKVDVGPFLFSMENAFGNVAGDFNSGAARSVGLRYKTPNVELGTVYTHRTVLVGTNYLSDDYYALGAQAVLGGLRFAGGFMNQNQSGLLTTQAVRTENYWFGITYAISAATRIGGAAYETRLPNTGGAHDLGIVSVIHSLSKRTKLYAETDFSRYRGSYVTDATLNPHHAQRQIGVTVGIDHSF